MNKLIKSVDVFYKAAKKDKPKKTSLYSSIRDNIKNIDLFIPVVELKSKLSAISNSLYRIGLDPQGMIESWKNSLLTKNKVLIPLQPSFYFAKSAIGILPHDNLDLLIKANIEGDMVGLTIIVFNNMKEVLRYSYKDKPQQESKQTYTSADATHKEQEKNEERAAQQTNK